MQHFLGRRYDTQDLRPKTTKLRQTDAFRLSLLAALLPVLLPAAQAEAAEGGIAIENCADSGDLLPTAARTRPHPRHIAFQVILKGG